LYSNADFNKSESLLDEVQKMLFSLLKKLKPRPFTLNPTKGGFSLVEALVAIGLLVAVVGGTLAVAARGLVLASEARDKITAFYLAQEPIEYIRYLRDSNRLSGVAWDNVFVACYGLKCGFDAVYEKVGLCTDPAMKYCDLIFQPSTGIYVHDSPLGGVVSKFHREVVLTEIVPGQEVDMEVTMTWQGRFSSKSFVLRDRIFSW
jgi:hypothetical protein